MFPECLQRIAVYPLTRLQPRSYPQWPEQSSNRRLDTFMQRPLAANRRNFVRPVCVFAISLVSISGANAKGCIKGAMWAA
jgi:hypothetical protein